MMRLPALLILLVLAALPGRALAGESADLTRQLFEAGNLAEGERILSERLRSNTSDDEARFGLGMVQFARAVEKFGQHHYRYGLKMQSEPAVPFLRMPVPPNPNPERLTYEVQRAALQSFLDDLAAVETTLAAMGQSDVKIPLDMEKLRLNLTGQDGAAPISIMAVYRWLTFTPTQADASAPTVFEVAFDRADAYWLRGYARLLSAGLEFILAYDWRATFDRTAGLFYPNLRPEGAAAESTLDAFAGGAGSAALVADVIALIHEIRWPVLDPARMLRSHANLKQVAALSRQNWASILIEADDDREWIPAPRQKNGVLPQWPITQERVDAWLAALTEFEAVLDGKKLLPHWRLANGINLRRVFEQPATFDWVLWATGHAAAPYTENGVLVSGESWALWQQVFNGDFLAFAVYFN